MKKIILILTILISGVISAKNSELQRPENIGDKKWASLKAAVEEVKLLPSAGGGVDHRFGTVSVDGNRMIVGAPNYSLNSIKHGAVYVFDFDGTKWNESEILTPVAGQDYDKFGTSVSLSGSRLLIGASQTNDSGDSSGTAFVYDFDGVSWLLTQKLTASDAGAGDRFGVSVSLSVNRALIGAWTDDDNGNHSGSAYIFEFDGNSWNQTQKITTADGVVDDRFGVSVSLSGNRALIGAIGYYDYFNLSNSGSAYIFEFDGNSWNQTEKLTAVDVGAGDFFGYSVSLSGNRVLIGAAEDNGNATYSGSAYLFDFDGSSWNLTQKITAFDGGGGDFFGGSVSLSANRALIGATRDDDNGSFSGSAYIFDFDGNSWNQTQKITASDGDTRDYFGGVSLSGNRAVIGASRDDSNGNNSGSVYVFDKNGSSWSQSHKVLAVAGNGAEYARFGNSVSLYGNRALIGATGDDDNGNFSGAAYVFDFYGGSWNLTKKLTADDGGINDFFGSSVSLSANRALIGADGDNSAYVFNLNGNSWNQIGKLTTTDGTTSNRFGFSVSLSANRALIGASRDDDNGDNSGAAYVFDFDGGSWNQTQKIMATAGTADDYFGYSVSLSGNRALIGAFGDDDNGSASGSAYVFDFDGSSWNQAQKIIAPDGSASDHFGESVSLSANRALIGAPEDVINSNRSGSAYVFDFDGSSWSQTQRIKDFYGAAGDRFGVSVSLSGNRVLIGAALGDDGNGADFGSAYVFDFNGSSWNQVQKIRAPAGAVDDFFGYSVSLSSNRFLIGAYQDDDNGSDSGSAYIFNNLNDLIFANDFEN